MAVDITHLRSYSHVCCLLLSFTHAVGLHVTRDVNKEFLDAVGNNEAMPAPAAFASTAPPTLSYDVTQNVVLRSITASDDVIENVVNETRHPSRRRRKADIHYRSVVGDKLSKPEIAWTRELAAQTLQELAQDLAGARLNCSATSWAVQSLNVELSATVLRRFSAEAASAVHAANVISLLLQSPAEMTSHGDAFYFSFARAIVDSAGDWVNSATLVVERPGQPTIGPHAARFSPTSSKTDFHRIRLSDVGRAEWYNGLLQRSRTRPGKAGRCGQESWTTREGDVVNKSTVVSELEDVLWSVPYVLCPSLALTSLVVPIYVCGHQHNVIIRSVSLSALVSFVVSVSILIHSVRKTGTDILAITLTN